MKNKYFYDVIFILAVTFLSICLYYSNYKSTDSDEGGIIQVNCDGKIEYYSLEKNESYDLNIYDGHMKIEVLDKNVRVIESSCENKDCIRIGAINSGNKDIVCLPNKVIISIIKDNKKDYDAIAY